MSKDKNKIPECVICHKTADYKYTKDGKLQVFVVPYKLEMAFMKFHFPLCRECYEIPESEFSKKIHDIACIKAGQYWGSKIHGGGGNAEECLATGFNNLPK